MKPDQEELDGIGRALATQPDPLHALALLLTQARRLTRAEAGTVYLRKGDKLHFVVVQNDVLAPRLGEDELQRRFAQAPLTLTVHNIAGYVALTRSNLRIADVYEIPLEGPYEFDRQRDLENRYRTCSILALPIRDARGGMFGVLQLINALNDAGQIVAFDAAGEDVAASLLTRLAVSMLPP
jgi:GAF domain-containing protein